MEPILAPLLNFGIGGAMAGAVIWFLYHMTQYTIPKLMAEQRTDQAAARAEFIKDQMATRNDFVQTLKDRDADARLASREALDRQRSDFQTALQHQQEEFQRAISQIVDRLEQKKNPAPPS